MSNLRNAAGIAAATALGAALGFLALAALTPTPI